VLAVAAAVEVDPEGVDQAGLPVGVVGEQAAQPVLDEGTGLAAALGGGQEPVQAEVLEGDGAAGVGLAHPDGEGLHGFAVGAGELFGAVDAAADPEGGGVAQDVGEGVVDGLPGPRGACRMPGPLVVVQAGVRPGGDGGSVAVEPGGGGSADQPAVWPRRVPRHSRSYSTARVR